MSREHNTASCTCAPSRGLACRRCYAPHYAAGLHNAGVHSPVTCGHSACSQNYIETGETECVRDDVPLIDPGKVADQLTAMLSRQLSDEGFDR